MCIVTAVAELETLWKGNILEKYKWDINGLKYVSIIINMKYTWWTQRLEIRN